VLRILGQKVHGGESFTDWRKRPLTQMQLKYAADDVRYLLALRDKLMAKAQERNRVSWVEGECSRLVQQVLREEERWRVAGSARLSRRQMAVLRELWRWRDRSAQAINAPAIRVLGDGLLVEIARRSPQTAEDLFALRGLDRRSVRSAANDIVASVNTALALQDSELPRIERHDDPPQVAILAKLLSVAANGLASQYEVDPALLATTADLQELVRWHLRPDDSENPTLLEGWRGDILGEPLLGVLEGKRCVRVGRIRSANPLVFDKHSS
jgi:ribonuclease D